jgi:cAMP phosphodiesterase
MSYKEQTHIKAILLSHSHIDHIKDIGFLADNVFGKIKTPIKLVSIPEVLNLLKKHFLNGKLWPDFTAIPDRKNPIYKLIPLVPMKSLKIDGLKVKAVKVNHTVDAVGFVISDNKGSIVYSGDTGPTDLLWEEANKLKSLRGVLLETSFPNSMVDFSFLEFCVREDLNKTAPRFMGVLRPLKVIIENYPDDKVEEFEAVNNPENTQSGTRKILYKRTVY